MKVFRDVSTALALITMFLFVLLVGFVVGYALGTTAEYSALYERPGTTSLSLPVIPAATPLPHS